jgi:hypothetical protein
MTLEWISQHLKTEPKLTSPIAFTRQETSQINVTNTKNRLPATPPFRVYRLYGLNQDEIKILEDSANGSP